LRCFQNPHIKPEIMSYHVTLCSLWDDYRLFEGACCQLLLLKRVQQVSPKTSANLCQFSRRHKQSRPNFQSRVSYCLNIETPCHEKLRRCREGGRNFSLDNKWMWMLSFPLRLL
jgi:hypothetical protein